MQIKYQNLLSNLEPFIITANRKNLPETILGKKLNSNHIFDPLTLRSRPFIERVYRLDELCFGGQGMGMDRWVFFDCAVMPGFVMGFMIQAKNLSAQDKLKLGVDDGEMVPLSIYIAIPTMQSDVWFGHNLASLNGHLELNLSGLGLLTKYAALKAFGIQRLQGATQWSSPALRIHARLGRLKVLSAYTPIHSIPETLCYECEVDQTDAFWKEDSRVQRGDPFEVNLNNLTQLQAEIEQGRKVYIKTVDNTGIWLS